jgi:hypothetical protein
MRASELTEFSTTDKKIDKILTAKGYKKLGSGTDQTAYLEPGTGYVLKIFGTQGGENFSPDHKMFFDWAKYCMKNSNNPFLPKFAGYESFVLDGDRYLQIRQELLEDAGSMGTILEIMASAAEDGVKNINKLDDYIQDYFDEYGAFIRDADEDDYQDLLKQLGPQNTQLLLSTLNSLYAMGKKSGYGFDLHPSNFMARANGTPVIVDPWVVPKG